MFNSSQSLTKSSGILALVLSLALLLAGLALSPTPAASSAAGKSSAAGFVLYGVGPGENVLDVPADSPVTAIFSADLDASTVSSATLRLHGDQTGRLEGSFIYLAPHVLHFQPAAGFKPGETVQASATGGLHSAQGAALQHYTWGFTVAAAQASAAFHAHPTTPSFGGKVSHDLALGDLDGDGDLDAVVANYQGQAQTTWLNDGLGGFSPHPTTPSFGGGDSEATALGDLDSDGDLDAVVANSPDKAQTTWLNDGTGAFSAHPSTPSFGAEDSHDIALGDLDGDGDLDAVVANYDSQAQTTWLNDGGGAFSAHPTTPSFGTGDSGAIALGDLDGDGDLDAVVANELNQAQTTWLNDGTGAFSAHPIQPSFGSKNSTSIALDDLDGDGDLDAVVANWNQAQAAWLNNGLGAFSAHPSTPSFGSGYSLGVALGDLDGDGDLDAVVANTISEAQTAWLNDGGGAFSAHPSTPTFGGGDSYAIALGDLDGDGDLDAVVPNSSSQAQTVWTNGLQHRLYLPLVVGHDGDDD
jgi:hypothetical protein